MSDLQQRAKAEIVQRHAFFVDWFTGKADDAAMDECRRSFAGDFRIIWPNAKVHECGPLLKILEDMRGAQGDEYAIEIKFQHAMDLGPDLVLITFDEHQWTAEGQNLRRATAMFSADAAAPNGVVWRHLHQTWIADKTET